MLLSTLLVCLGVAAACTLPGDVLPNNITEGFAIQVQNASYPVIHNRLMNLWAAGGGDQHLYLAPAGTATNNLTLVNGVITRSNIRAVINGEYTASDNTTKLFMTQRGDPRAIFDVVYGCNPDTDEVQVELAFKSRAAVPGGHICVRSASGGRHEFRYSPAGNPEQIFTLRVDNPSGLASSLDRMDIDSRLVRDTVYKEKLPNGGSAFFIRRSKPRSICKLRRVSKFYAIVKEFEVNLSDCDIVASVSLSSSRLVERPILVAVHRDEGRRLATAPVRMID
ncbi:hypothetical protein S40288_10666 [Stachybotrys chartarum IBT 40288]|nr:hypothetical protein S40288_10666 [Stachybotrys chartarum IBT 40288]